MLKYGYYWVRTGENWAIALFHDEGFYFAGQEFLVQLSNIDEIGEFLGDPREYKK